MTRVNTVTRRKVLGGIVASSVASLGGCAAFEESNEELEDTEGFERVTVEGTEQSSSTIEIRPDTQITELLLGRNHPDEMYDGASERTIQTEVILTLENTGSGPDAADGLVFSGDKKRELF